MLNDILLGMLLKFKPMSRKNKFQSVHNVLNYLPLPTFRQRPCTTLWTITIIFVDFLQSLNFSLSDIWFALTNFFFFMCAIEPHSCAHMNDCFHLSRSSNIYLKAPISNYAYGFLDGFVTRMSFQTFEAP
jgi:hypothetical protein